MSDLTIISPNKNNPLANNTVGITTGFKGGNISCYVFPVKGLNNRNKEIIEDYLFNVSYESKKDLKLFNIIYTLYHKETVLEQFKIQLNTRQLESDGPLSIEMVDYQQSRLLTQRLGLRFTEQQAQELGDTVDNLLLYTHKQWIDTRVIPSYAAGLDGVDEKRVNNPNYYVIDYNIMLLWGAVLIERGKRHFDDFLKDGLQVLNNTLLLDIAEKVMKLYSQKQFNINPLFLQIHKRLKQSEQIRLDELEKKEKQTVDVKTETAKAKK